MSRKCLVRAGKNWELVGVRGRLTELKKIGIGDWFQFRWNSLDAAPYMRIEATYVPFKASDEYVVVVDSGGRASEAHRSESVYPIHLELRRMPSEKKKQGPAGVPVAAVSGEDDGPHCKPRRKQVVRKVRPDAGGATSS